VKKNKKTSQSKFNAFQQMNEKLMSLGGVNEEKKPKIKKSIGKEKEVPDYVKKIVDIFEKFHPLDLFKTLLIAETYLENINHYVKFSLLFDIYFSIKVQKFGEKRIQSYEDFSNVLKVIYCETPHNPMVEDFYPIADWGTVKYQHHGIVYQILYGSCLTDTYSYFDVFALFYNDNQSVEDLKNILKLQNNLILSVDQNNDVIDREQNLCVPDENFRNKMLEWLNNVNIENNNESLNVSNGENTDGGFDFYSRYMNAEVNPYCYFKYENKLYPFSLRNQIVVLVEYYNDKNNVSLNDKAMRISEFLKRNLKRLLCGSFRIRTLKNILNIMFSGVFQSGNHTYFILPLDSDNLNNLKSIINKIKNIMSDPNWGIQKAYSQNGLQPRDVDGGRLTFDKIRILVILPELTTRNLLVPIIDETNIEFSSINEFVSVVDSMESDDDLDEFIDYYKTIQTKTVFVGFNLDGFASFKHSHGLIEDGATVFSMIMIDAHDSPSFRYEKIIQKYGDLPLMLPDDEHQWYIENSYDENYHLVTNNHEMMSWSTCVNDSSIHFLFDFKIIDSYKNELTPRVLELFSHAAADAFSRRKGYLYNVNLPKGVTINLLVGKDISNVEGEFKPSDSDKLITNYEIFNNINKIKKINVFLNLDYCFFYFKNSKNAKFQTEICIEFLKIFNEIKETENIDTLFDTLLETNEWKLRMTMGYILPKFDVIDKIVNPIKEIYYKKGRQELAKIFKSNGIETGLYKDVNNAKEIINDASGEFREYIHNYIKKYSVNSIIETSLYEYSILNSASYLDDFKQEMSLKHEVSYDRSKKLAEMNSDFKKTSQLYRYLIECTLMLGSNSSVKIEYETYQKILGCINWLLNMYHSSDGLHYDLGVEGIEIDFNFIPEIILSEKILKIQDKYNQELSSYKLGIGINSEDELKSIIPNDEYKLIDLAFYSDLNFGFRNLFVVLHCLSTWSNVKGIEIQGFYKSNFDELISILAEFICNPLINIDELERIIKFLILDSSKINILEGVETAQFDVPVGDHSKRTNRLNIKPLISLNDEIIWSPACTYRSLGIWTNHITDGYLPADFNFPTVNKLVDDSKIVLEKQLEKKAFDILSRYTHYIEQGIDLKKKFKHDKYPDIGDYDVLAFLPESNCWIMVECKYNQPAYCLKDMSRLRQRIFGKDQSDKSQIFKVKRRYEFLLAEHNKIRSSMQWPTPNNLVDLRIINLYVSKNTYWWFRCPPYQVDLSFVQVDHLEEWLNKIL